MTTSPCGIPPRGHPQSPFFAQPHPEREKLPSNSREPYGFSIIDTLPNPDSPERPMISFQEDPMRAALQKRVFDLGSPPPRPSSK